MIHPMIRRIGQAFTFSTLTRLWPSNLRSALLKAERDFPDERESLMDFSTILGRFEEEEEGEEEEPPGLLEGKKSWKLTLED